MISNKKILFIDLPTFPKGVIPLSFPAIAACLPDVYPKRMIDLNLDELSEQDINDIKLGNIFFVGIKVSCQNFLQAISITKLIKNYNNSIKIIWGGEFPTLLPDKAVGETDAIVCGSFENVAGELVNDLENNCLKKIYKNDDLYDCMNIARPDYSIIKNANKYFSSMGFPLETSRGCDKKCTFCLVHTMQPKNNFKSKEQLREELKYLKGKFVNVIDYNIGSNEHHLRNVMSAFKESEVQGWMGEMCLETLDNDELLIKLKESKCKMIYCGLESISENSLRSVNKAKTNIVANYSRIIKKVQKHGIQIGAGIIVGLAESNRRTIEETFGFYQEVGLIYAKITFLTYNPGTKVYESMKRVGTYAHEEPQYFDGNHFSYLPFDINKEEIVSELITCIKKFYSLSGIFRRAKNAGLSGLLFREFVYFNLSYRYAYFKWLKNGIFDDEAGFEMILHEKFKKPLLISWADKALSRLRMRTN